MASPPARSLEPGPRKKPVTLAEGRWNKLGIYQQLRAATAPDTTYSRGRVFFWQLQNQ
jgi:hypothetical protein